MWMRWPPHPDNVWCSTANQPLAAITPTQVTVTPAAPFTVVSSGRSVAVQFTYPLDPDTEYSIDVADVQSSEGGPAGTLTHRFRTGSPPIFLLQRRDGEDAVFVESRRRHGGAAFEAEQIEDFRSARDGLVAVTTEGDLSQLTAVSTTSGKATPITLPGAGFVSGLQVADHDSLVGYVFTDEAVGTPGALESTLFLGSITDPKEDPIQISVGDDSRVQQWAFVPQTSYLLVLTFDGQLHPCRRIEPGGGSRSTRYSRVDCGGRTRIGPGDHPAQRGPGGPRI